MHLKSLLFVASLMMWICVFTSAGPIHAQCKVDWELGVSCRDVFVALVQQIKKWRSLAGCTNGGQKCLYQLTGANRYYISAKHTSPVTGFVDHLRFNLVPYALFTQCHVAALSVSEAWYTLIDHSTNYCNLYNLMEGSGLTEVEGYKEMTNDWICNQRSTANCTEY
ncbi:hypothetical protein JZ751_010299 [Albula glossodonta]|uniref:Uncharacterized protein n=1 Tax=Albula glossodonta TaxID=121402 RepID=A0A8T2N7G0_9TELE|nr:hypothetical protein JZ751_010299 [Albula glossodonta]